MSRHTVVFLLLAVPTLSLLGCDTSKDNCEGRSPTYEDTFWVANVRSADGGTPAPGTPCEELCYRAGGYQQAECRVNNEGSENASVTCIVPFVCD
ncbi:MAG TPA: hypothetical protein VF794_10705 [Archangium sp.]|jgi:hypothetical protein|uniref:hypothetical protein n=1 Tax=Archangium sp. TaxID=1872627 RepID=UPI002ED9C818